MTTGSSSYVRLNVGDPAPWFHQRCTSNPNFAFDTVAGRYVVMCFFASADDGTSQMAMQVIQTNRAMFDDERVCLFGVSIDPSDERDGRVRESVPGIRHFWDFDGRICREYGVMPLEPIDNEEIRVARFWFVLDPTLRVIAKFPFAGPDGNSGAVIAFLRGLPPPDRYAGFEVPPPILVLPNVFEPDLCRALIAAYERDGGEDSGFMREVDGRTVSVQNHAHKRRKDCTITDDELVSTIQSRITRRITPEIRKVYSFNPTRMERYIVGCYAAEDAAHFRAHRDNTTKGTAHRRFAVSINLNAEFEGGAVSFPEYSSRSFKATPGGAIVFPCALLHAVSRVTSGRRYAFLPFLYDEKAAQLREENSQFLADGGAYKAGTQEPTG